MRTIESQNIENLRFTTTQDTVERLGRLQAYIGTLAHVLGLPRTDEEITSQLMDYEWPSVWKYVHNDARYQQMKEVSFLLRSIATTAAPISKIGYSNALHTIDFTASVPSPSWWKVLDFAEWVLDGRPWEDGDDDEQ